VHIAKLTILIVLILAGVACGQGISSDQFDSDEELYQAYLLGEISYNDYLLIKEILATGLDSTNSHLLDFIPNLAYFLDQKRNRQTKLEIEQEESIVSPKPNRSKYIAKVDYRYYQKLKKEDTSRYHIATQVNINKNLQAIFKVEREYSGYERIIYRAIRYKNKHGLLDELYVGNFSKRLGLGTVAGYRGKFLDLSREINDESLLFPDYGGSNGLYVELSPCNKIEIQSILSYNRDDLHEILTSSTLASIKTGQIELGFITGLDNIKNRSSRAALNNNKLAISSKYKYSHGYTTVEAAFQTGDKRGFGGIVTEGRHYFQNADLRYSLWSYSDNFLDISSGSKAGNITHTEDYEELGLSISTGRTGVEGGLFKTIIELSPEYEMVSSLIYSGIDEDNYNIQYLAGLIRSINEKLSFRLDHIYKTKKRYKDQKETEIIDHRTRLESTFSSGNLSIRGYIGYQTKTGEKNYLSLFLRLRNTNTRFGSLEFRSSLSRIDIKNKMIDYWYSFIRIQQQLFPYLTSGIKLSHSYSRSGSDHHNTTVILEATALL